jgi:C4-dicarboxylate-specific signal transduction histidine kinase
LFSEDWKVELVHIQPGRCSTRRSARSLVSAADPKKREIQIVWPFDENLPKIPVDHIPIQEAFINLISNAIEALENNRISPLIKVRAAVTDQNEMVIQVIDNGPGVNDPEKIFDAFVTTKEKGSSSHCVG